MAAATSVAGDELHMRWMQSRFRWLKASARAVLDAPKDHTAVQKLLGVGLEMRAGFVAIRKVRSMALHSVSLSRR